MIIVNNITKSTKEGIQILKGISFTVNRGEFVGILGPSGAGKTLTMRCITGLTQPTTGEVKLIDAQGVTHHIHCCKGKNLRQARQKIGNIFQGSNLVKRLTVLDNVLVGQLGNISPLRSIFFGFTNSEAERAIEALEKVKIAHLSGRVVSTLSGGEMQRVAIARALFQDPVVMLADEPISNLDPENAKKIMEILNTLSGQIPIIGVFHQPEIASKYCTRIIAIKSGKIIHDGDPKLSQTLLQSIYGTELNEMQLTNNHKTQIQTLVP